MQVRWPTAFDLIKLCTGSSAQLGLHSDTVQTICRQFAASRDSHRRCPRFRASFGAKRALGWVPFIARAIKVDGDVVTYLKRKFHFWHSRNIGVDIKAGAFVQDARGRWYVVFQCEVADALPTGNGRVGIDLGLKALATCSDGVTIPAQRHYRRYEAALAIQQRAGNKKRIRAVHAKIANARRHHLHEWSTRIARNNQLIVVGDVGADGKVCLGRWLVDAAQSAPLQGQQARSAICRSRRTMDFPNVLVLRGYSRQQSEGYGRDWSKTLDLLQVWRGARS
jgi:putative transposase